MSDTRVALVDSLIRSTESGKLKWDVGARSDQYYATLPSGSVVVSRLSTEYSKWNSPLMASTPVPISGGTASHSELPQEGIVSGSSAGAPTYSEVADDSGTQKYHYTLEVRDTSANIIDIITSEMWKWLPSLISKDGIKELYEVAQKSIRDAKDKQLGRILNDLKAL